MNRSSDEEGHISLHFHCVRAAGVFTVIEWSRAESDAMDASRNKHSAIVQRSSSAKSPSSF
jgi:hypothetical protein